MTLMNRYSSSLRHPRHTTIVIDAHPLSTRLIRARRVAKVTQVQLATLLGINPRTVMSVERGRVPPLKSTRRLIEMWVLRHEARPSLEWSEEL
jgi:DNA-binding XRE family transcriptional regulator